MEKYLNSNFGKGTYDNALNSYRSKDAMKNYEIEIGGKKQKLGTVLRNRIIAPDKIDQLFGSSVFHVSHDEGVGKNWWKSRVTTGDANTDSVTFNADITSNLRPDADDTYDIGTTANRWKDIHAVTAQGEVSVQNHITASGTATLADQQYGIWIGPFSISGTVDIGAGSNFVVTSFNRMNEIDLLNYSDY